MNPKITPKIPIILASKSSIRQEMLNATGLEFSVKPADIDERALQETIKDDSVEEHVKQLAQAKALFVSQKYTARAEQSPDLLRSKTEQGLLNKEAIVIGADQIGMVEGDMLYKPKTKQEAIKQLSRLVGKTHYQHNATCFYHNGKLIWSEVAVAALTMRNLSVREIESYIEMDNPIGCCGAYKFESLGVHLFNDVVGSPDVIQGLSLLPLLNALQDYGVYGL